MKPIIILNLLTAACVVAALAGCTSVRDNVPATTLAGTYMNQPYSVVLPKDESFSNFDLTVTTNGSLTIHVTGVTAAENPAVITMSGNAYQVMRKADSDMLNGAISQLGQTISAVAAKAP